MLVLTRPDRRRGRGRVLAQPPVAESARALGLTVLQPERLDAGAAAAIAAVRPDAVCVCAFGAIIREPLLSAHPMLNVHPSLLPRWRGAAPIERAIMAGDPETGVCVMRPTAELDAGPVALERSEPIVASDTYGTLSARLAALGAKLLIQVLDADPPLREQDPARATYAEKIGPEDRWLDPALPAASLERRVRALEPHIGARVRAGDEALGVRSAQVLDDGPAVGELVADRGRLILGCAVEALELLVVHPPGGRAMDAAAYLRGRQGTRA